MLHVLVQHCSSVGEMKRINKFPQRPRENKVRCKSRAIMRLNECFILLTVSSRKGNFLLTDKNQNNVSWQPFTNVVTIYKVNLIFPPLMIKTRLLNRLEFEIDRIEKQNSKTKKNTWDLNLLNLEFFTSLGTSHMHFIEYGFLGV